MFEQFFLSMQQDIKLFVFFPLLCAVFRGIFIYKYNPYDSLAGHRHVMFEAFRFGFWWGMDFNAYAFLLPLVFVTLPGLFFPVWFVCGDLIRLAAACIYATVLFVVFVGKMLFYQHFQDIFNHTVFLARRADKKNLAAIFFHQYHGMALLLAFIPYMAACIAILTGLLDIPSVPYPHFSSSVVAYAFNTFVVIAVGLGFYFFRYGGTLVHDNKPEWDTIPDVVKDDVFFSKAAVDDLVALEDLWRHPMDQVMDKSDDEYRASFESVLGKADSAEGVAANPLDLVTRTAAGPRIKTPSHIFLIVGESYGQFAFDDPFTDLHIADGGKGIRADAHTATIHNFLASGVISRPSIVSLMSGIFDAGLELNERESFWQGTLPTSLPVQLKKLGYKSVYWYGGSTAHGNFNHFAPACGFDEVMAATHFCGKDAPHTWVGVYDHIFLDKAAELIENAQEDGPVFHFLYTTSNHGPYKMNLSELGFDMEKVMADAPDDVRSNGILHKVLGTYWYSDQAIAKFFWRMKAAFPDALFLITGDHGSSYRELQSTSFMKREYTFREGHCPIFMMNHRDITQELLQGNTIGGHMNIMPTIMELIAPKGFTYYSLEPSLLTPLSQIVTPYHWLTKDAIGDYERSYFQDLTAQDGRDIHRGEPPFQNISEAQKNITAYLLKHPELLKTREQLLENRDGRFGLGEVIS